MLIEALRPGIAPDLRASKAHAATTRRRECPAGIEPASPAWKAGASADRPRAHVVKRKGRESNPQGREARPGSSGVPSPVGLPFRSLKAPVGGIEPPIIGLTGRRLTVWPHRIMSVRTAGFEPAISCSRGTRNTRLSYVLNRERPAGVEPAHPPWQGDRLPLHHGRLVGSRIVKDPRAPGGTRSLVAALRVRCLSR